MRQCEDARMEPFDAIILAGGGGRRLGGVDKASLTVGNETLLSRALHAVGGAERVVVVGPPHAAHAGVTFTSEHPPGGGPVAAMAAGLGHVKAPVVVVLACDMPNVSEPTVVRLVTAAGAADASPGAAGQKTVDGALLLDPAGRRQPLAAAYRRTALAAALTRLDVVDGAAVRNAVRTLTLAEIATDAEVTLDCDTWGDVERCRRLLEE